ncbi:MAG TPA: nucleoside deaminase [Phycisphaerae bacterium]|nr:nucleoside deaminase [Phycisphaerae bacterium]
MTDADWMRLAIEKSREAVAKGQTPFGAVIVSGEGERAELVVAAHNVVFETTDITAHGEVNAIRLACRKLGRIDLRGCTIYSSTEPCPMCFAAIHWAGIGRIVYGASIADARAAGFNELSISNEEMKERGGSGVVVEGAVLKEEAAGVFREFLKRGGKVY